MNSEAPGEDPDDPLEKAEAEALAVYESAKELEPGQQVAADVEMVRWPDSPERTLDITISEIKEDVGPEYTDGSFDILGTDADGQDWRIRSVKPTPLDGGMDHRGTANLYLGDHWAGNSGIVHSLRMDGDGQ